MPLPMSPSEQLSSFFTAIDYTIPQELQASTIRLASDEKKRKQKDHETEYGQGI